MKLIKILGGEVWKGKSVLISSSFIAGSEWSLNFKHVGILNTVTSTLTKNRF